VSEVLASSSRRHCEALVRLVVSTSVRWRTRAIAASPTIGLARARRQHHHARAARGAAALVEGLGRLLLVGADVEAGGERDSGSAAPSW
jgi:hypothetical protein